MRTLSSSIIAASTLAAVVHAAAADKGSKNNTPPALPEGAASPAVAATADKPVVLGIASGITRPTVSKNSRSAYPFDQLEIDQSIGIKGRTKASFSSIVYQANKRYEVPVIDEATGQPKTEIKVNKDGSRENVKVMQRTREFEAFDVDPKTDPEGASVRIFRNK